jgi:aminoglycoside phosphotransferase (APT) family kinase protein
MDSRKPQSTDPAVAPPPGEELDAGRVLSYLKSAIDGIEGDIRIEKFVGGYSNLTYLVTVGERELVLRRPPFGKKAKSAHDMSREYRMLSALGPVFPYCPQALALCEDESVLGCPFFVMEHMKGIILHEELPPGLTLSADEARRLSEKLVEVFCELHAIDFRAVGLEGFGKPEGYVRRQVEGWSRRYRDARTPDVPDFESVMGWLHERMPPDHPRAAVIHNDFKLDNAVLDPADPERIVGILDWEMATVGDPLMDLGGSLAYWVQADDPDELQLIRQMPTHLPGMLTREQQVELYARKAGIAIDNFDYYYCFGLFRLAVIAQQIYYRFYHGQTRDERFGLLGAAVGLLEKAASGVVARTRA